MDAVQGRCHAYLIDRLRPTLDHLPLASGDVPQIPGIVETPYLRPAQHEGFVRGIRQDRPVAEPGEGLAAVDAYRHAYSHVERHGFAARPARVIGAHFVAVANDGNGIDLMFLKTNPFEYKQFNNEFVPWLSIIDIMMFNSKDQIIENIRNDYILI